MKSRPGIGHLAALAVALALLIPTAGIGLSGAAGTGPADPAATAAPGQGYWLASADGAVYGFGAADTFGVIPARPRQPIAGAAATPTGAGYWLVGTDGGLFSFGDASFFGSTGGLKLNRPVVGMAATPTGAGYWFVAADGGIFSFGDAAFYGSTGSMRLNKPIVGMAPTPTGAGYWLVASDGGVFTFGDAAYYGSTGDQRLNAPVVGLSPTPTGRGYWFVAADGGVFNFGDAGFVGSTGGKSGPPITAMTAVPARATRPTPRAPAADPSDPAPTPGPAPDGGPATTPEPVADQPAPVAPAVPVAPSQRGAPFDVGLIGDTGYSQSQKEELLEERADMDAAALAFTMHVGDIWSEADARCRVEDYMEIHQVFDAFAAPFVYTPGDNEWADCPGSTSGALTRIRDIFFSTNQTLGQRKMTVERQPGMPENARFMEGGVVFFTNNEPGATGRGGTHRDRNIEWLNGAFDQAEATGAAGVVVGWQDNPFEPSGGRLVKALQERTRTFGKPVVLVHGDTHHAHIDHPWKDLPNFTRVEVEGDSSSGRWYRMTVDPQSPNVFTFKQERD